MSRLCLRKSTNYDCMLQDLNNIPHINHSSVSWNWILNIVMLEFEYCISELSQSISVKNLHNSRGVLRPLNISVCVSLMVVGGRCCVRPMTDPFVHFSALLPCPATGKTQAHDAYRSQLDPKTCARSSVRTLLPRKFWRTFWSGVSFPTNGPRIGCPLWTRFCRAWRRPPPPLNRRPPGCRTIAPECKGTSHGQRIRSMPSTWVKTSKRCTMTRRRAVDWAAQKRTTAIVIRSLCRVSNRSMWISIWKATGGAMKAGFFLFSRQRTFQQENYSNRYDWNCFRCDVICGIITCNVRWDVRKPHSLVSTFKRCIQTKHTQHSICIYDISLSTRGYMSSAGRINDGRSFITAYGT